MDTGEDGSVLIDEPVARIVVNFATATNIWWMKHVVRCTGERLRGVPLSYLDLQMINLRESILMGIVVYHIPECNNAQEDWH